MSNLSISSNFVRFDSEGLELVVDTTTGKAYASISATARMLEVETIQVRRELEKRGWNFSVINAEIPTAGGIQGGTKLIESNTVFKLAFKYHPRLAEAMGAAGANVYMLGLAGYSAKVELPTDKLGWMKLAVENEEKVIALAAQLEAQKDDVQFANAIAHTQGATDISVGQLGKTLANPVGRTKMFDILREIDFIMQKPSVLPYQSQIDAGRAKVITVVTEVAGGKFRQDQKTLITAKGEKYLVKRLTKESKKQSLLAAAESMLPMLIG